VSTLSLILAGVGIWLMVGLVIADVAARNLFSYGILFAKEYTSYIVPVVGVGGAAYCLSKNGHIRADILLEHIPDRSRQWCILFGLVGGLVFTISFGMQTFIMALHSIEKGVEAMYPTETLLGYPQLLLAVGFSLLALQLVIEIVRKARLLL